MKYLESKIKQLMSQIKKWQLKLINYLFPIDNMKM